MTPIVVASIVPLLTGLASVGGLLTGAVALILRFRKDEKDDERDDESQEVATLRGVANDALERAKVAYTRLDAAEGVAAELRAQLAAVGGELDLLRPRVKQLEEQHTEDIESIKRLERANRALDNDLKRLLREREHGNGTPPH